MATQRQIEANRRNAQKSTGPRTFEGKAMVARNALGSGIWADREVVLPVEDPDALTALKHEYLDHFHPAGPDQRCLVDSLVSDEWLLRRFRRIEGELMTRANNKLNNTQERFCLADNYERHSRLLERLQRRINATRKSYLKTLECLQQLQKLEAERQKALDQVERDQPERPLRLPDLYPGESFTSEIGFVPSNPRAPLTDPVDNRIHAPRMVRTAGDRR